MEFEIRFYFPKNKKQFLEKKLDGFQELECSPRTYEKTMQFDHPCPEMSFYQKEIDGRFRLRVSSNSEQERCKISWKRRLNDTTDGNINKEEEVELTILPEEQENLLFLLEKVIKMRCVESYERYRTTFSNDEVEIALDKYPFGIALEIESKNREEAGDEIENWADKLGLKITNAYRLSWDDKYAELCKEQGVQQENHVEFGKPMPEVKE